MRFIIILFLFVGFSFLIIFIYLANLHTGDKLTNVQENQALTNILGRKPILKANDETAWNNYKDNYVSFSYPAWATIYTNDNLVATQEANVLSSFHFGLTGSNISGIITVVNRPDFSNIKDEPAVNIRLNNSDFKILSNENNSIEFEGESEKMEFSYFVFKNSRVYSLVVSGPSHDDTDAIFNKLLSSFSIK